MSSELESRHAREDVKSPERPSADPTPAPPTSEWMCRRCFNLNGHGLTAIPWNCANCGLAYGVATLLYDIPPEALGAAPDQAEGPREKLREIL